MARVRLSLPDSDRPHGGVLVTELVRELRSDRASGQPFIYEQEYPTGRKRVLVVWDRWAGVPLDERTAAILAAYEAVEGRDFQSRIALASGVTVPEAFAARMLPFHLIAAHRSSDPVSVKQVRDAMLEEGATQLQGSDYLQLRFPTEEAAEAARKRLVDRLPESNEIWLIRKEPTSADFAEMESAAVGGA